MVRIITIVAFLLSVSDCCGKFHFKPDILQQDSSIAIDQKKPYALVAGGSKGIGYAIAEALAKRGFNLILIARHIGPLKAASQKLESTYHIHAEIMVHDLSKAESAEAISKWCIDRNVPLKVLCNVAGMGGSGDYLSLPLDTLRYMVNLNTESGMALTLKLLPLLEKNTPSYILNVASMAGYAPIPEKNLYSATKSSVIFFSYALRYQLKEKNISVSCLTPGPVFTKPSIREETRRQLGWIGMKMAVPPARVGEIAVRKTLRGKLMITPGVLASCSAALLRALPRRWVTAFYYKVGKRHERRSQRPQTSPEMQQAETPEAKVH
jgi:uncharacterized protein